MPEAAERDSLLYERLALIDAIRDGQTHTRNLAEEELKNSLEQVEVSLVPVRTMRRENSSEKIRDNSWSRKENMS